MDDRLIMDWYTVSPPRLTRMWSRMGYEFFSISALLNFSYSGKPAFSLSRFGERGRSWM